MKEPGVKARQTDSGCALLTTMQYCLLWMHLKERGSCLWGKVLKPQEHPGSGTQSYVQEYPDRDSESHVMCSVNALISPLSSL